MALLPSDQDLERALTNAKCAHANPVAARLRCQGIMNLHDLRNMTEADIDRVFPQLVGAERGARKAIRIIKGSMCKAEEPPPAPAASAPQEKPAAASEVRQVLNRVETWPDRITDAVEYRLMMHGIFTTAHLLNTSEHTLNIIFPEAVHGGTTRMVVDTIKELNRMEVASVKSTLLVPKDSFGAAWNRPSRLKR